MKLEFDNTFNDSVLDSINEIVNCELPKYEDTMFAEMTNDLKQHQTIIDRKNRKLTIIALVCSIIAAVASVVSCIFAAISVLR